MAFISKSVTDTTKVSSSVTDLAKIQSGFTGQIDEISKAASTAISSKVIAPVSGATVVVTGTANNVLNQVNGAVNDVNSFLQSAVKSITSTFDSSVKGLAAGLDSKLSNLFKDTNVKTAAAKSTIVSDPIKTNLIDNKLPTSSSFKITGFEAGSQSAGMSGSSSQFGSNAASMISTKLSTVMNRFNLDSTNSLANGITTSKANASLKGLFSTVKSISQTVGGIASTVRTIGQLPNIVSAEVSKSIENNIQSFLGRAAGLSNLTGINASSYYLGKNNLNLMDQSGNLVTTTGSGTDASTANAILSVARLIGCDTNNVTEYSSVDELSSLFNMILSLASERGLSDLVNSLLGCSMSSTAYGQTSVLGALNSVSNKDISLTNTLITNITDSSVLYKNQTLATNIISNPNLSASDITAVINALSGLSYTPTDVFEIDVFQNSGVSVYDESVLNVSERTILDNLFEDTTLSTYLTGQTVSLLPNGTYAV